MSSKKNICLGAGLVALDVVLSSVANKYGSNLAGGSCGNVLAILSFLGWKSYPIGLLKNNNAYKDIISDLQKWGVDVSFLFPKSTGRTPIIIQKNIGKSSHKFLFNCPICGAQLPKHKRITLDEIELNKIKNVKTNVFYFDRVSDSTLKLAEYYKNNGAIIFFEPSRIGDVKQFDQALFLSHFVKYSHNNLLEARTRILKSPVKVIIETLGKKGLRVKIKNRSNSKWLFQEAFKSKRVLDTVGAGDWCTAGIIYYLFENSNGSNVSFSKNNILEATKIGQAYSALSCGFKSARGMMFNSTISQVQLNAKNIIENKIYSVSNDLNVENLQKRIYRPCICKSLKNE